MKNLPEGVLRAWWWHRQALDGRLADASPAEILAQTGWARSVGGAGPYLTLFSRGGISREAADKAAAKLDIHELPSARGCTYVVPACDYPVALAAAQLSAGGEMKVAEKLGVTEREIDKLCEAVLAALAHDSLDPDDIRVATGDASRNLGEVGKKKGLTTTLPVALGRLQVTGEIRRIPANGRLDQQRYRYTLWRPRPTQAALGPEEVCRELARRYFTWIGPATVAEFQWFSSFSAKDAKAAIESLKMEKLTGDRYLFPADREALAVFKPTRETQYALVGSLDGLSLLRRDLKSLFDENPASRKFLAKGPSETVADLPSHGIFERGRLVGLWEYDPASESIAWTAFVPKDKKLQNAVTRMEEYIRTHLGDARSFSLDSPKSRAPRIDALRQTPG